MWTRFGLFQFDSVRLLKGFATQGAEGPSACAFSYFTQFAP